MIKVEIESLKEDIKNCEKCRLFETRMNALPGEGNLSSRVMLIAQAPGEKEDKTGRMFVGPTGEVLDEIFNEINIKRSDIYMTNLIKCMLPRYRKPGQNEVETCSQYLDREIELVAPDIVAPLGYYATRYIFKEYDISQPESREDYRELYGNLFLSRFRKIYPLAHPTTLLFNESKREKIKKDYSKIKIFLKVCEWYTMCPMKRFYERDILDTKWIELYCKGDWKSCVRYELEESGEFHPDWMLPDGTIDEKLREKIKR